MSGYTERLHIKPISYNCVCVLWYLTVAFSLSLPGICSVTTSGGSVCVCVCVWFSHQLLSFGTPAGILQCSALHLIRGQLHFLSVKKTNQSQKHYRMTVCVCVCVCVCVSPCMHVFVVYEDTNVYNDMGMTGITRKMWFMRTFSVSP